MAYHGQVRCIADHIANIFHKKCAEKIRDQQSTQHQVMVWKKTVSWDFKLNWTPWLNYCILRVPQKRKPLMLHALLQHYPSTIGSSEQELTMSKTEMKKFLTIMVIIYLLQALACTYKLYINDCRRLTPAKSSTSMHLCWRKIIGDFMTLIKCNKSDFNLTMLILGVFSTQ